MDLAWHFRRPKQELLESMSGAELDDWFHYARLCPIGPVAEREILGLIVASIYNVNRKKGASALTPKDVLPDWEGFLEEEVEPEELLRKAIGIFRGFGLKMGENNGS